MADLVVVMGEGRIRQAASPVEIYRRPADAFVADFIGSTNLLDVDGRQRRTRRRPRPGDPGPRAAGRRAKGDRSRSGRRTSISQPPAAARSAATVTFVRDLGGTIETFVEAGGHQPSSRSRRRASGRDVARRPDRRRRAAARRLRGAEAMRREAPQIDLPTTRRSSFPALMLIVFFVVPFGTMIAVSFFQRDPGGFYEPDFVFDNYAPLPVGLLRQRARLLADAGDRAWPSAASSSAFPSPIC